MTKIIPIRDLKDTTKISEMCHEEACPIFITKNGYQDLVIMSAEVYDRITAPTPLYPKYSIPQPQEFKVAEAPATIAYNPPQLKIYTIDEIKEIVKPIFDKFKVKSATLFGSYAKGKATTRSDIDMLVDSGLRGWDFCELLDEVCNAFSCPIDLIDKREVNKGSKVEKEIKETGVKIYGK